MGHNWWAACAGQGGMLALSLAEDLPEAKVAASKVLEAMPQWFAFEGDVLQNKPRSFDEAGGMYESVSYANYGIQEALLFLVAYKNMYPQAQLPKIPQLNKLADFYFNVCYPSSSILRCMNFGDGGSYVTGLGNMSLANYLGYPINNLGWYASMMQDGTNKEELYRNNPIGFLYTIYENDVRTPLLPTSHLWKTFGWATMRDSWQKDATMLAVKSGYTWNHTHADANSFILVLGSLNFDIRIFLDEITTSVVDSLHTILPSDSLTSTCHRIDPPHLRADLCLTAVQNIDRQSKLDCNNRILFCHFQAQTRIPLLVMQEIKRSTPFTSLGSCCEFTCIHGFLITVLAQDEF